jgi:hypothetical protein
MFDVSFMRSSKRNEFRRRAGEKRSVVEPKHRSREVLSSHYDIIIGTGSGDGALACKLVPSGEKILQRVNRRMEVAGEEEVDAVS